MQDIVPELLDKIQQQFTRDFNNNSNIKNIYTKINNGTATHIDVHKFAIETGKTLADSFNKYITVESLPDGRMYYNIAERILNPRSEEHTSELQSRFDLVCRLLLEKKNNKYY